MDDELFELCKEVYRATKWEKNTLQPFYDDKYGEMPNGDAKYELKFPLYTSDYLLDKLPHHQGTKTLHLEKLDENEYGAYYGEDIPYEGFFTTKYSLSDTPLKALLKFTLTLHDEAKL